MADSNRRRAFHIVDALNAEWDVLASNSMEMTAAWAAKYEVLAPCRSLGDVLLAIRSDPDGALGALLTEVSRGDELAGRAVLQAMLGKLVRMAQADEYSGIDDYVAVMWCRIRTYPLATRPRKIAANLVLDTLKQVTNERRVLLLRTVQLWPPGEKLDIAHEEALRRDLLDHQRQIADLTAKELLDSAGLLGLLDGDSEGVLSSVYADGLSSEATAHRLQISAGSVRVRCSRAVKVLARHRRQLLASV
jgi:DNA-directed RNA polymerase specialized sigma24 family protein